MTAAFRDAKARFRATLMLLQSASGGVCVFLLLQREMHGYVLQADIAGALGHVKDFRSSLVH
jgi:hypothetical protein